MVETIKLITADDLDNKTLAVKDNKLQVAISNESGNILTNTDTGLFVKTPDISVGKNTVFYVSTSEGNDSNEGTRAAPLATIKEAFKRAHKGFRVYINLKEDEEFNWAVEAYTDADTGLLTTDLTTTYYGKPFNIGVYGPKKDAELIQVKETYSDYDLIRETPYLFYRENFPTFNTRATINFSFTPYPPAEGELTPLHSIGSYTVSMAGLPFAEFCCIDSVIFDYKGELTGQEVGTIFGNYVCPQIYMHFSNCSLKYTNTEALKLLPYSTSTSTYLIRNCTFSEDDIISRSILNSSKFDNER